MEITQMQPPPLSHRSLDLQGLLDLEQLTRTGPPPARLSWSKQLLRHVRRLPTSPSTTTPSTNLPTDPLLLSLLDSALKFILFLAHPQTPPRPNSKSTDLIYAEALFLSADLSATGEFPTYKPKDLRTSFRCFESSARAGWQPAWYRLGRDYEGVGDPTRAVECFERGLKGLEKGCLYRLGMALLLGQLSLAKDTSRSISLLRQAADLADEDLPTPAYLFGMLLAGEVDLPVPQDSLLLPHQLPSPPLSPPLLHEARLSLSRHYLFQAAHLGSPQAQLRLGQAFEHASLGCTFDPLLSVQWYLVASQNGAEEADMGLAKWFLVGSEGHLEKNEGLAFSFAEKAAKRGLAAGIFGLGYFWELGIGRERDLGKARKYYRRAAQKNNTDAIARLAALSAPIPAPLSQADHLSHVEFKLVRKRTDAQARSERMASIRGGPPSTYSFVAPPSSSSSIHPPAPPPSAIHPQLSSSVQALSYQQQRLANFSQQQHGPPAPVPAHPVSRTSYNHPPTPYPQANTNGYQHTPTPTPHLQRFTLSDVPLEDSRPQRREKAPAGPQTFSEMGFEGSKASGETDCRIM